ncbi:hypothetical protein [Streptomyces regalis]|uniref:hypothetical protein n=1 Tax=Streptomyces regalis TaxID=68262 RepID=UPI000ACA3AB0|nr:hypothetical protein [Streptomyces regalis]
MPGIGVRYDLTTRENRHLSVVAHHDGQRTINAYQKDDPDACSLSARLTAEEAATLIDALMPAHHTPNLRRRQVRMGTVTVVNRLATPQKDQEDEKQHATADSTPTARTLLRRDSSRLHPDRRRSGRLCPCRARGHAEL